MNNYFNTLSKRMSNSKNPTWLLFIILIVIFLIVHYCIEFCWVYPRQYKKMQDIEMALKSDIKSLRDSIQALKRTSGSDDTLNLKTYELRIKELEFKTGLFKDQITIKQEDFNTALKIYKSEVDDKVNNNFWTFIVTIVVGVIAFLGVRFDVLEKTRETINKEAANIIGVAKEDFTAVLDKYRLEKKIKKDKKILVISFDEKRDNTLMSFFEMKNYGFNQENIQLKKDSYDKLDDEIKKADLVILNDEYSTNEDQVHKFNELIQNHKNKSALYFNVNGIRHKSNEQMKSQGIDTNFSNSKYTLYEQILNSLIFQENKN